MKSMRTKLHTTWIFLATLLLATTAAMADDTQENKVATDPQPEISDTISELIHRLEDNREQIKLDSQIAYDISNELITPHIDFPRITRLIIGKHWRKASEEQRARLINEIQTLLIRSYVTAMTSYADEIISNKDRIQYHPSRFKPGDRKASVRATIGISNGQTADVRYQVYFTKGEWKIYDIRIEGISLAITYRSSFDETIKRKGLDKLIEQLAERNLKGEVELPSSVTQSLSSKTSSAATQP
ncbi:hypothetical protein MNBD_GAMMA15-1343 [hydrothermal vent metagenome]|uniref:Phospholipid ABC transporter shuttle protein MlaC n=1 Tax=hydrothermal vent metagenome TaxID=652676 RepID=A0A3B0Y129_9ZZZZ